MPTTLRVLTYNILLGGERREAGVARVLERSRADVIALQEASDLGLVCRLAERLGMRMLVAKPSDGGRLNLVLLSRHPVARWRNHRHHGMLRSHLVCELTPGGALDRVRVHVVHLAARFGERANGEERRMHEVRAVLADIARMAPMPHVIVGDFNAVAPGDQVNASEFFARMQVLRRAGLLVRTPDGMMAPRSRDGEDQDRLDSAWADAGVGTGLDVGVPTLPWIVGPLSDLIPRRPTTDRILNRLVERWTVAHLRSRGYVDCYRALHDDPGYTCATWMPACRIDYAFADPLMARRLERCEVLGGPRRPDRHASTASDHYPLIAEFGV